MENQIPKVGVGVMILKDGKVLLGKRKGAHGAGDFAFPGGHLEHMETFEECALREVKEECGIEITNLRFQLVGNIKKFAPKHYVQITLIADWKSGEPKVLEPDRCEKWEWYDIDTVPENIMATNKISFESIKTGRIYFSNVE